MYLWKKKELEHVKQRGGFTKKFKITLEREL